MYKINQTNNSTYAEVGQINPLRWKTLFRENAEVFSDQSGWIKCKDFYNDTVAYFKEGSVFSIYSYQNVIKKNDEGVYFLLNFVKDKALFTKNMEVVNERLKKDLDCQVGIIDIEEKEQLIILIPTALWETTYRISMITMVVRLCNYDFAYKTWEDLWSEDAPANKVESAFSLDAKKNALTLGFLVPEKFTKYWWYCNETYNSVTKPKTTGGTIHNCGCTTWSAGMKGAV